MNISSIYSLNSINTAFKSKSTGFRGNNQITDTFVKSQDCKDEKSFENFELWARKHNFLDNVKDIVEKTGAILGEGFEGVVYEIPDTKNWVIKEYKRSSFVPIHSDKAKIIKIEDISPQLNIGQTIALVQIPSNSSSYSYQYWILKRQTGKSYGVGNEESGYLSKFDTKIHLNSLKKAADLPQKAYDKCIKDIKYITNQGYAIDYCNPNNIMIDDNKQEINFIDINDHCKKDCTEQYAEILYLLLDSNFGMNFNLNSDDKNSKIEAQNLSKIIIQKFFKAMENQNAKFNPNGQTLLTMINMQMLNPVLQNNSKEGQYNELKEMNLI